MKPPTPFWIGLGLAAAYACLTSSCRSARAESTSAVSTAPAAHNTASVKLDRSQSYLFVDWNDIEKGRVVPVYEDAWLTDDARKSFAQLKQDYHIETRIGKHGSHQYHVAHGVRITVEPGKKSPRWLVADRPWEDAIVGGNVILDHGKFRCWYLATMPKAKIGLVYSEEGRGMETNGSSTCYMESDDGLHWVKPSLHIFKFNGSMENNIVSPVSIDTPFLDEHGIPEERYKAFLFDELPAEDYPKGAGAFLKYGLYGMVSPDGYHWTRLATPLIKHFADTQNIAGWDPLLKKYVAYIRGHAGGRSITRAETDDFHNWPMPETVFCTGPEEPPPTDYYSSGYTTYPGIPSLRLMFPAIYHLDTSTVDVRLAVSRDGYGWNRVSSQPVIELGRTNEWDCGMLFGQPDLLRLGNGRLALSYIGYNHGHDTDFALSYKKWTKTECGIAWATWEDGRLAGVETEKEGDFFAAMPAANISALEINARTAAHGRVEVELVDKETVLPGYSFADCVPLTGDNLWSPVRFKGKDIFELRGKKFQIHFHLVRAKVFGYRTFAAGDEKN